MPPEPAPMMAGGDAGPVSTPVYNARTAAFLATEDASEVNEPIYKALDRKFSIDLGENSTLADLLKQIRSAETAAGKPLPIYVSRSGLQEEGLTLSSPVEVQLDDVPLKVALRLVLKDNGLAYCVRDGVLIISSPEEIRIELMEALFEFIARRPGQYVQGPHGFVRKSGGFQ